MKEFKTYSPAEVVYGSTENKKNLSQTDGCCNMAEKTNTNRYDFVILFECKNGNPNGDPDAGNLPRMHPDTGYGYVTGVSTKSKIRRTAKYICENSNFIDQANTKQGYQLLMEKTKAINSKIKEGGEAVKEKNKTSTATPDEIVKYIANEYYDSRVFGAVLSTGKVKCNNLRGAVQIHNGESLDSIAPVNVGITRSALTNESEILQENKECMMGNKTIIPFGLYFQTGEISAIDCEKNGVSNGDLELFFESLRRMYDNTSSADRGEMSIVKIVVFKHDTKLGNASHKTLREKVMVKKRDENKIPNSYKDYLIELDETEINGIHMMELQPF